jgi:hypothetical protein
VTPDGVDFIDHRSLVGVDGGPFGLPPIPPTRLTESR